MRFQGGNKANDGARRSCEEEEGRGRPRLAELTCTACLAFSSLLQDLFLEFSGARLVFFVAAVFQLLHRPQEIGHLVGHGWGGGFWILVPVIFAGPPLNRRHDTRHKRDRSLPLPCLLFQSTTITLNPAVPGLLRDFAGWLAAVTRGLEEDKPVFAVGSWITLAANKNNLHEVSSTLSTTYRPRDGARGEHSRLFFLACLNVDLSITLA